MNNHQQIFDTVLFALRKQGVASVDSVGNCLYRGPDGLKCAAGHLIPDELYDGYYEDLTFGQLVSLHKDMDLEESDVDLIIHMQEIHDTYLASGRLNEWENRMWALAKEKNLVYTPPAD